MPQDVVLTNSATYEGKYELNVRIEQEAFKKNFLAAINALDTADKEIVSVNFIGCFFDIDAQKLKPLFDKLTEHKVQVLGLMQISGEGLGYFKNPNIQATFNLIAEVCKAGFIRKIDLSRNGIGNATEEQQIQIIRGLTTIIPHIIELNLSNNSLEQLRIEQLKYLFMEVSKSSSLVRLALDGTDFFYYDNEPATSEKGLELFRIITEVKFRNSGKKWQELSLENINIQSLEPEKLESLLLMVEQGCISVDLSHNQLQSITNEQLLLIGTEDVVDKLVKWINKTELKKISLEFNDFSGQNVKRILEARSGQVGLILNVANGNGKESSTSYAQLQASLAPLYVSRKTRKEDDVIVEQRKREETFIIRVLSCLSSCGLVHEKISETDLHKIDTAAIKAAIILIAKEEETTAQPSPQHKL